MKKHRRLLDKSPILGFSKRILVLIAIFSIVFVSGSAFAARNTGEAEFFKSNYVTQPIVYEVNVQSSAASVPETGNHGFLTGNIESYTSENKTFISPIIVCLVATIVAFLALTKAKSFQRKNAQSSKTFGLSGSSQKTFQKIKNPALLLAICFGLGVSSPFFIFESISSIATTGVEKINYKEHDFDTDIAKGINPFDIAFKEIKTQSTSDTDFSIAEVKLEAETYNPTGYYIFIETGCKYTNRLAEKTICDEEANTDLVGEKAKIPSIKESMSIDDLKKQKKAGWGWSTDGKNFYSADTPLPLENGGSVYFAIRSSAEIPSGKYKITNQITAITNDINNEFAEYKLAYDDGTSETKTFYKKDPGHFKIKSPADPTGFKGWAETGGSDKATYQPGSEFTPILLNTILYAVYEKEEVTYNITFDQGYYFQEMIEKYNAEGEVIGYEPCSSTNEDYYCGEDENENKKRAGEKKYQPIDGTDHFRYIVKGISSKTTEDEYQINLNELDNTEPGKPIYVPMLKGYTFLGWTDFDPDICNINMIESHDGTGANDETELENTIACLKDKEKGTFYHFDSNTRKFEILSSDTSEETTNAIITLTPENNSLNFYAVYKLNEITYGIDYYNDAGIKTGTQITGFAKMNTYNGRIATATLDDSYLWQEIQLRDGEWQEGRPFCNKTGNKYEADMFAIWEDLANINTDGKTISLMSLKPASSEICTDDSTSGRTLSSNSKSTTKNLLLALNSNLENDEETTEEESEDEKQEEKTTETTEPTEPKKAEKRAAPAASSTETEKTEEEKDENLKEQTDDNGTTLLFYDDTSTVSPYYTRPLGVKEETLSEEPESNIVTTICIIVLIVSGLGITAIILFPVLSKNHAKKQTLPKF